MPKRRGDELMDLQERGFRVSVCLRRVFTDERAKCYMWVEESRQVRWLQQRLCRTFGLQICCMSLLCRGHLLPPDEPLTLLGLDDLVEVIMKENKENVAKSLRVPVEENQPRTQGPHDETDYEGKQIQNQNKIDETLNVGKFNEDETLVETKRQALLLLSTYEQQNQELSTHDANKHRDSTTNSRSLLCDNSIEIEPHLYMDSSNGTMVENDNASRLEAASPFNTKLCQQGGVQLSRDSEPGSDVSPLHTIRKRFKSQSEWMSDDVPTRTSCARSGRRRVRRRRNARAPPPAAPSPPPAASSPPPAPSPPPPAPPVRRDASLARLPRVVRALSPVDKESVSSSNSYGRTPSALVL